jgi:hypothetical protein
MESVYRRSRGYGGGKNVSYSANLQGSVADTSVDPLTGDVTVRGVSW